jgi:hypothetical protein
VMAEWHPAPTRERAPDKATENGRAVCPCASWARTIDDNFRAAMRGEAELDHAELCDGKGEVR